jgi:CheY-like chemotaxis protein/HPt (histidine-containing phosphotransfer) domain-containing protein
MLTSGPRSDGVKRSRQTGLSAYLYKPVRQAELLTVLTRLHARSSQAADEPESREAVSSPSPKEAQAVARGLRILVVEDHPVNQKLAVHLLQKQAHQVTIANNGKEALSVLEQGEFDLALMDIQMPEMDGFEAIAQIRAGERATGAHLPVLALTARAMKGDRERCLAAGLDGYVSKPIRTDELSAVITQLAPKGRGESEPGLVAQLRARSGVDEACDRELLEFFLTTAPESVATIEQALAHEELPRLIEAAHTLAGISLSIGAERLGAASRALEEAGRFGNIAALKLTADRFRSSWDELKRALEPETVTPLRSC